MIYGYCRVSTASQNLKRQLRIIKEKYPGAKIFSEKYTGTTNNRPEWNKLVRLVKPGDTIVFEDVSRFSRDDAESAFNLYTELFNNGIELEFISKPHLNTSSYKNMGISSVQKTGINEKVDNGLNMMLDGFLEYQFTEAFKQSHTELENIHKNIVQGMAASDKKAGHKKGATYVTKREVIARDIIKQGVEDHLPDDKIKDLITAAYLRELPDIKCKMISDMSYYKYKRNALNNGSKREYPVSWREVIARDIIKQGLDAGYSDDVIKNNIADAVALKYPNIKHPNISDAAYNRYKQNILNN
jgi:hypothetical protein